MNADELAKVVHALTREWFKRQVGDLPSDELPSQEEIERYIAEMRDDVLRRISPALHSTDCLKDGQPDDAANRTALAKLVASFKGLERTTPIFTSIALSKQADSAYTNGWALCAIRLIAETWLPEARRLHDSN